MRAAGAAGRRPDAAIAGLQPSPDPRAARHQPRGRGPRHRTDAQAPHRRARHGSRRRARRRSVRSWRDAGQIEQVILNLSINARDAMAEGGVLTIEVTERELVSPRPRVASTSMPGRYATLAVIDSGSGDISADGDRPDLRSLLHDEAARAGDGARTFDSSRHHQTERRRGSGILRGWPWIQLSASTFRAWTPDVDIEKLGHAAQRHPNTQEARRSSSSRMEPDVGKLARRILERRGYRALLASTPSEAIAHSFPGTWLFSCCFRTWSSPR